MTRERAKELLPIIQAFAEGREIQVRPNRGRGAWEDFRLEPNWDELTDYRIKPEPRFRPWSKPEDVPGPVCWIRYKGQTDTCAMVIVVDGRGVYTWEESAADSFTSFDRLSDKFEHSTTRAKDSWKPCGVEE